MNKVLTSICLYVDFFPLIKLCLLMFLQTVNLEYLKNNKLLNWNKAETAFAEYGKTVFLRLIVKNVENKSLIQFFLQKKHIKSFETNLLLSVF